MALSIDQFLDHLTDSGLLSAVDVSSVLSSLPNDQHPQDVEALARELVKQKKLTKFQAEQLYAGKGKSLTLGNYVILDKLGQGGMGMVLKAWHRRMERTVALKVIAPKVLKDAIALKRFQREVVAAAKLTHPNIVAAYDADEAKGTHFLVMEHVAGADLSSWVKQHGPMSVERAVNCVLQAARGLAYAHEKGVIHRDIKPHNLLMDQQGTVKILDMGLARIEAGVGGSAEHADLTNSGAMMGTVDYMAPEQAMDSKQADARSDIYSLGCTLCYLLTGHATFVADTVMKRLTAHQNAPPPSLVEAVPNAFLAWHGGASVSSSGSSEQLVALNAVFQRMVAKKPADRLQSMNEVVAALEQCHTSFGVGGDGATSSDIALRSFLRDITGEGSASTRAAVTGSQRTAMLPGANEATIVVSQFSRDTDPTLHETIAREANAPNLASKKSSRGVVIAGVLVTALLLAVGFFAMRGPSGTLHLEVGDELTQVTVGETGHVVKGISEEDLRLPVGEYVLHIEREKLAFDTDPFEVTKSETVTIKVERVGRRVRAMMGNTLLGHKEEPRTTATAALPGTSATETSNVNKVSGGSDREVAEWVINNGGDVSLLGQKAILAKVADLPREPFQLWRVQIGTGSRFTVADGQRLARLPELTTVGFTAATIGDGAIQALANCRRLSILRMSTFSMSEAVLSECLQLSELRILQLVSLPVTDDFVAGLGQLRQLQDVNLYDCPKVRDEGLVRMAAAPPPKLQRLSLSVMKIGATGMKALPKLAHLQDLLLREIPLDDDAISELENCPALSRLQLIEVPVSSVGVSKLQKALANCQILGSDPGQATSLYGMAYHDAIRRLMTRGFRIEVEANRLNGRAWIRGEEPIPAGDVVIANSVWGTSPPAVAPTPDDLKTIAQITDLRVLTVTKLPPGSGLSDLAPLQNLNFLAVTTAPLSDADVAQLSAFRKLSTLDVVVPNDAGLEAIARLPHLSHLVLRLGTKVTSAGLKALESAPVLSQVNLNEATVPLPAAQALANARPDVIVLVEGGKRFDPLPTKNVAPLPAKAPFDAKQARAHQEAWVRHLGVPVEFENSIGMKFVLIPPGEFLMGASPKEIADLLNEVKDDPYWTACVTSEGPQRRVTLTQPFYLARHEVRQKDFSAVMGVNPSSHAATGQYPDIVARVANRDTTNHPVEHIEWNAAADFCAKLSVRENLKPAYFCSDSSVTPLEGGNGYRLPTEAEWEFACRAGSTTQFPSGERDGDLARIGWYGKNSDLRTHAVGELNANAFGLFDMCGNVFEFVEDGWQWDRQGDTTVWLPPAAEAFTDQAQVNPRRSFLSRNWRVMRGGHVFAGPTAARSSTRSSIVAHGFLHRNHSYDGFRAALSVEAVRQTLKLTATMVPKSTTPVPPAAKAPFDARQARAHQEAWAKHLGTTVEATNSVGATMVLIPPGEFLMGSTPEQQAVGVQMAIQAKLKPDAPEWQRLNEEIPQHTVVLTRPFQMGATEVTTGQFRRFVDAAKYVTQAEEIGFGNSHLPKVDDTVTAEMKLMTWRTPGFEVTDESPVTQVTWNDAVAFCNWLSTQEGATPLYEGNYRTGWKLVKPTGGYRLPTEAEWEYACRAGTTTQFWFGNDPALLNQHEWHRGNADRFAHAVGTKSANPFGLFDMSGNVREHCHDFHSGNFYSESPIDDPLGPSSSLARAERGGMWNGNPVSCRAAMRSTASPFVRQNYHGFRVVRVLDSPTKAASSPPIGADPDRRAAEWVIAHGGDVKLIGREQRIANLKDLPEGKLELVQVKLFKPLSGGDADLVPLRTLKHVTFVGLDSVQPTTAGIAGLERLPKLQSLSLAGLTLNDEKLAALIRLKNVAGLFLVKAELTAAGCAALAKSMPQLKSLNLMSIPMLDDAAVEPLGELRNLLNLELQGTQVTAAGVAKLQKALPNCAIHWDGEKK